MKKRGFTLVELLVVIAIIGVLVALLLPAVQAAHEAARRMQCGNNMKQIGIGLQNYHDTFNSLPYGSRARYPGNIPITNTGSGPSWYVGILPFCEQKNLYDLIDNVDKTTAVNYAATATGTTSILKPGAQPEDLLDALPQQPIAPNGHEVTSLIFTVPSYVGIAGANLQTSNNTGATGEVNFNETRLSSTHQGGTSSQGGLLCHNQAYNMSACTDGTSNTIIASEASDYFLNGGTTRIRCDGSASGTATTNVGGWWWRGGGNVNANFTGTTGSAQQYNIRTIGYSAVTPAVGWNGKNPTATLASQNPNSPLLSAHPNGVMSVFLDGHVQLLTKQIPLALLKRLATRDDGQQIQDF